MDVFSWAQVGEVAGDRVGADQVVEPAVARQLPVGLDVEPRTQHERPLVGPRVRQCQLRIVGGHRLPVVVPHGNHVHVKRTRAEAACRVPDATGRPFVGAAGFKVSEWWRACGLNRTDFYITNVYPYRPPGNDINTVPKGELETWVDALHDRLAALTDPWVIVPTGNTALAALTGKRGITKHRGSIYACQDRRGRSIKVIPTIHPAAVFRTPLWERRCRLDWQRISGDASFRELRTPVREHFTRPTLNDVEAYVVEAARADVRH